MEFTFTLRYQLASIDSDVDALLGRLDEEGCDDALVGIGQPGRIALAFIREAPSAAEAIRSALADVHRAIPDACLIEATPDFVGLTDLADYAGISRQGARKLAFSAASRFPAPIHAGSAAIWHLAEVLIWMRDKGTYAVSSATLEVARVAMEINVQKGHDRLLTVTGSL